MKNISEKHIVKIKYTNQMFSWIVINIVNILKHIIFSLFNIIFCIYNIVNLIVQNNDKKLTKFIHIHIHIYRLFYNSSPVLPVFSNSED